MNCNINAHQVTLNSKHAGASSIPLVSGNSVANISNNRENNGHLFKSWSAYKKTLPDLLPTDILIGKTQTYPRYVVRTITSDDCIGLIKDMIIGFNQKQVLDEFRKDPRSITAFEFLAPGHYLIMQPERGTGYIISADNDINDTVSFAEALYAQNVDVKKFFDLHIDDVFEHEGNIYRMTKVEHTVSIAVNTKTGKDEMFFSADTKNKLVNFLGQYDDTQKTINYFR